ncbi:MAG: hypothetical protein LBK72_05705, partial [Bifidobacteriaceae bacterium]|nr:hypothetical protein [Bifidobacteriaceae bacterium]
GAPSAPDPPARAALPAGASGPGVVDTPRRRPQLRAGWAAQPGLTPGSWSAHAASPADATGPPHDAIARARGFLASLNEREAPHHGDRLAVPDHPMSLGPGGRRHESDRDSGQLPVPDHPMSFPSRPLPGPGGSSPSHQHSAPPWPQPPAPLAGRHSFAPAWPASKAPGTPVDADTATDADTAAGTDTGTEAQP